MNRSGESVGQNEPRNFPIWMRWTKFGLVHYNKVTRDVSLFYLFIATGVVALWVTSFQIAENAGIRFGVSIIPPLVSIAAIPRVNRAFDELDVLSRLGFLITMFASWFPIDMLSIGPVVAIQEQFMFDRSNHELFYDPVVWIHDNTMLEKPLEWHSGLWGWH